ncbi:hypothetical protein D3C85_1223460 [compost metagenome]
MLVAHQAAHMAYLRRRGRAAGFVANAAHALVTRLLGHYRNGVGMVQPGLGDDCIRYAVAGRQLFDEAGFANRVLRVPFGLDIHRLHHIMRTGIGEVILRKIATLERTVITVAKRDVGLGRQPGMAIDRRVPEVMMGVDDRSIPKLTHGAPRRG